MQSTTIWNSALIQQTIEKLRQNIPSDMGAFYQGDVDLRADNIFYQLTPEEILEFQRCSDLSV